MATKVWHRQKAAHTQTHSKCASDLPLYKSWEKYIIIYIHSIVLHNKYLLNFQSATVIPSNSFLQ